MLLQGLLLPLCQSGTCTLREAVIFSSVINRVSIPVVHSAAAMLRLAEMPYAGTTSFFIRVLLDKKYALPYRVVRLRLVLLQPGQLFASAVSTHSKWNRRACFSQPSCGSLHERSLLFAPWLMVALVFLRWMPWWTTSCVSSRRSALSLLSGISRYLSLCNGMKPRHASLDIVSGSC